MFIMGFSLMALIVEYGQHSIMLGGVSESHGRLAILKLAGSSGSGNIGQGSMATSDWYFFMPVVLCDTVLLSVMLAQAMLVVIFLVCDWVICCLCVTVSAADVHAQTGSNDTALTYSCENGHIAVVEELVKHGAALVSGG